MLTSFLDAFFLGLLNLCEQLVLAFLLKLLLEKLVLLLLDFELFRYGSECGHLVLL
jgi:hypothetical protein